MYKIENIDEVLNLMSAMTNDNRFEEIIEEVHEKEANYMCEVIDIMINKGRQEGLAEGRQEGLAEGAELEKKNIAQGMKKKGFDISLIMELTGLSKEMILSL